MSAAGDTPPLITLLNYQDGVISLGWTMQGITPTTQFQVSIKNDSTGQTNNYPATGFFADIEQALEVGVPYTATVAQDDGGQIGPPSLPVPVITVSPIVTLVQNTGTGLLLKWQQAAGYDNYAAVLQQLGHKSITRSVTGLSCFFDGPLVGTGYSTGVAAQTADGVSTGPVGQVYTPIMDAPTLTQVQNTGDGLLLVWQLLDGYSKFLATLQAEGAQPDTQSALGNSYTFEGALIGSSYTTYIAAQSDDGVLVGPPSLKYHPILVAPTMTLVENTGAGLKLAWAQLTGYSRYLTVLEKIGQETRSQSVEALTWTFDGTLSGSGYRTVVSAQSDDQILIGPPSAIYEPITGQPTWAELDYDAGQLVATWQQIGDASVTGYLIQITGPDTNRFPTPNTNTITLPVALQPVNYAAVVRATSNIVLGPWSAPLVLLTAPPTAMALGFDGEHLRASWGPSGQGDVTGYVVQLLTGGQVSETFSPPAPPQTFASGLNDAVSYTAQARATGLRVKGPWCAPAVGPFAVALVYAFDALGRVASVTWTGVKTQTYTFESAGNLVSVQYS